MDTTAPWWPEIKYGYDGGKLDWQCGPDDGACESLDVTVADP